MNIQNNLSAGTEINQVLICLSLANCIDVIILVQDTELWYTWRSPELL